MKVYGFDSADIIRGELQAAYVDAATVHYGFKFVAQSLDWEFASTSFAMAKGRLQVEMKKAQVDPELIKSVGNFKAAFIPIQEDQR